MIHTFFFAILSALTASAVVTFNGATNASRVDTNSNIIYGGTAGAGGGCTGTGLCNNCTDAPGALNACNQGRINQNTQLTIFITSNTASGKVVLMDSTGGATFYGSSITSFNAHTQASLTIPWTTICGMGMGHADCSNGGTLDTAVTLKVGINANGTNLLNEANDDSMPISFKVQSHIGNVVVQNPPTQDGENGIFSFTVFPGDAKVYLDNLLPNANFPISTNVNFTKIHLLSVPGTTCAGMFGNSFFGDPNHDGVVSVGADGTLSDSRVYGFSNGTTYAFKLALEDQAGNLGLFVTDPPCPTAAVDAVFGILRNKNNCFIATAAFGSPFSFYVQTLRNFRDRFLITQALGRKFVSAYYDASPPFAKMVADHGWLRATVRIALYPLWLFAYLALKLGFPGALAIYMIFPFAIIYVFARRRKSTAAL